MSDVHYLGTNRHEHENTHKYTNENKNDKR